MDPYDQNASPYVGLGNDPMNGVDEDGGLFGLSATELKLASMFIFADIGGVIGGQNGGPDEAWKGVIIGAAAGSGFGAILNAAGKVGNLVSAATLLKSINGSVSVQTVGGKIGAGESYHKVPSISIRINDGEGEQQKDPPEKTLKELIGKNLYDLDDDELKMIEDPYSREVYLGGKYTIKLSIWERLYLAGHYAGFVLPTAKAPRLFKFLLHPKVTLRAAYEAEVRGLSKIIQELRAAGKSS